MSEAEDAVVRHFSKVCSHEYGHVYGYATCIDLCIDMCIEIWLDMCIAICMNVCLKLCIDMCMGPVVSHHCAQRIRVLHSFIFWIARLQYSLESQSALGCT